VHVDALATEIQDQVDLARAALRRALDEHDDYLADIHRSELDALVRTADEHGVRVQPEAQVIDLTAAEVERTAS
jgi:CBS-domain-containing membrane protein